MNRFIKSPLVTALCATGLLTLSSQASAAAFQLWEQDGASVGNYHAGYAAEANDASIGWYNPAGIVRIKNQQFVLGAVGIATDFKYKGNISLQETPATVTFNNVTAQGGAFSIVPDLHYVAPINDWIGFGFNVVAPFGLKTSYGVSTPIRYAATLTSISVVDISPSLGMRITDKASVGAGLDIQKATAKFNSMGGLISPRPPFEVVTEFDSTSTNRADDTGYGFHLGYLYEFTPCTRLGISYHSQVVHHFSGSSKFEGQIAELANALNNGTETPFISSGRSTTNVKLPPYTTLSMFNQVSPSWAVMGTVTYTQWNTFKNLVLDGVAGVVNSPNPFELISPSNDIEVSIPEHYRNSWNASVGADYYATETITIRSGLGYDQTPVRNGYRNIQLPDGDRYAIALGGHFKATQNIGMDVGWSHIFLRNVNLNPPAQVNGAETIFTNGRVKGGADVLSGQVVWDIV